MSRAQLLAAGVSRSSIDRAVCAGRLHRVHRGVYAAVAPELLTEEGHLVAALLAAGDGALLSHGTAAWRWRIIAAPPSMIELAVPRNHAQTEGLTVFVSRNLRAGDTTRNGRFPTTSVARTLLDLATRYDHRALLRALAEAEFQHDLRPAGRRAHLASRAPGQRQPPRGAEGARPGPRGDEEPPGAALPRPPHRTRHRASAAQPVRRAVDGRLPVARAARRRRARRPPARAPAPSRHGRRPRPLAAPPPLRDTTLRQTPDRAAARRRHRRPPRCPRVRPRPACRSGSCRPRPGGRCPRRSARE